MRFRLKTDTFDALSAIVHTETLENADRFHRNAHIRKRSPKWRHLKTLRFKTLLFWCVQMKTEAFRFQNGEVKSVNYCRFHQRLQAF